MICKYCGADIQEGSTFCTSCGAAVDGAAAPETVEAVAEETVVVTETPAVTDPKAGKGLGIASLILGIISIPGIGGAACCACLGGFGSIITAVVGIILGILSKNKAKAGGAKSTLATVGIVLSIIALVGIVLFIILNGVLGAVFSVSDIFGNMEY